MQVPEKWLTLLNHMGTGALAIAGSGGGSHGSAVSIRRPMSQLASVPTTKKGASPISQRVRSKSTYRRLKMRRTQTYTTVYFERHTCDPFGADQVFNPFGDLGARADAP